MSDWLPEKGTMVEVLDHPKTREHSNYKRYVGNVGEVTNSYVSSRGEYFVRVLFPERYTPLPLTLFSWRVGPVNNREPDWRL